MQIVIDNYFKSECDVNTSIRQAFEKGFRIGVKKGQSAELERKKGKWIAYGDIPKTCSCCHEDWDKYVYGDVLWYSDELPNYCPNCGSYNGGEQDEKIH